MGDSASRISHHLLRIFFILILTLTTQKQRQKDTKFEERIQKRSNEILPVKKSSKFKSPGSFLDISFFCSTSFYSHLKCLKAFQIGEDGVAPIVKRRDHIQIILKVQSFQIRQQTNLFRYCPESIRLEIQSL